MIPCAEGFHWIGQSMAHCDQCGLPAWDHAGFAEPARPMTSPFDEVPTVLVPFEPGQAERLRLRTLGDSVVPR